MLQGTLQPTSQVLESHVQSVRLYTRDFSQLNLLLRGEESSDRNIVWSTMDFISNFNQTPPFSTFTLDDLLMSYNMHSFAVRGTVITLLESVMLFKQRNHLPFSDGGLSVSLNDGVPMLMSIIQFMRSSYEQEKRQIKTAINVAGIMGGEPTGVHSDYYALGHFGIY